MGVTWAALYSVNEFSTYQLKMSNVSPKATFVHGLILIAIARRQVEAAGKAVGRGRHSLFGGAAAGVERTMVVEAHRVARGLR